jgi:Zn-dependent peptidase ImmA (M78 family)
MVITPSGFARLQCSRHLDRCSRAFAAELLMPEALLRGDLKPGSIDALDEVAVRRLARKYGVSAQAVTIRLSELGLISGFGQ